MSSEPCPRADEVPVVPLDEVALGRLRELDPDGRHHVVDRVLTAFDTSLARLIVQLTGQRDDGQAEVISRIAHTLKSSSFSVGALPLARACADVEKRLREGIPGDLGCDVERLLMEGQAALASVRAMLRR